MDVLTVVDRRLGCAIRRWVASTPGGEPAARVASALLQPAFEGLVAVMAVRRNTRTAGLRAGGAAVASAMAARALRDAIARPRPGARTEGGFPSRHAAAAVAITRSIRRSDPRAGAVLGVAAATGLVARVATSEHDPADILAGAALGAATEWALSALADRVGTH